MGLEIGDIQRSLAAEGLDGWLLYDFHGSNPIAARLAGLLNGPHMTTRRWYYLIPASGEPKALVHAIERHNLDHLPGAKTVYAGREQLDAGLTALLQGRRRIAMEYSPGCAIPYLSRLDAGTAESLRARGVDILSSGNLVQRFEATWSPRQLETHRRASEALYRIKDRAFEVASRALRSGEPLTEYALQQQMADWFVQEGLVSDSAPVVALGANAGNPHYLPVAADSRTIEPDSVLLLDLWGKMSEPEAVYADITWVGMTGRQVAPDVARAFGAIAAARDAAVALVSDAVRDGHDLHGFEVDKRARGVLESAGYGHAILHRTGHSLGESVHGNGVHLDDYETHDDRLILPGAGFTVEPGLYFEAFGVRTEINVYRGDREVLVTGARQQEVATLL